MGSFHVRKATGGRAGMGKRAGGDASTSDPIEERDIEDGLVVPIPPRRHTGAQETYISSGPPEAAA